MVVFPPAVTAAIAIIFTIPFRLPLLALQAKSIPHSKELCQFPIELSLIVSLVLYRPVSISYITLQSII